ncbi:MAG: NAD(P)/FAD-dependent oxidoreductase [Maritimibacter sp.]
MAALDLLTANDTLGQYPNSWYAATAKQDAARAPLQGETRADVCIIGAGYTGLSAALHMAQAGLEVVVLEASRIGFGASGRNGGQLHPGQRLEQDTLEHMLGKSRARDLWDLALEGVDLTKALAAKHAEGADFAPGLIHADHKRGFVAQTQAYVEKLARDYAYDKIEVLDRKALQEKLATQQYHGGILDHGGGHLHPLKYAIGLARGAEAAGARLYETSRVVKVTPGARATVETGGGRVSAAHVLWAANGYLGKAMPEVAKRVMPINNFILVTEPLGALARNIIPGNEAVADSKFVINYYRLTPDGRMLFGGGESYGYRFPRDIADKARAPMIKLFPQLAGAKVDYAWGGTLAITMNRMPHFARLTPNILSMSGYSGHGIATATLAGKLASECVQGQAGRFDMMAEVPSPRFPGGALLRAPLLAAGMAWFALRDRL